MSDDLVRRLSFDAARAEATFSKGVATNIEDAADLIEQQAEAIEMLAAEIERLQEAAKGQLVVVNAAKDEIGRRDAFIKELSDALLAIRPLGGSELFVQRFGQFYADPAYCKAAIVQRIEDCHEAKKEQVRQHRCAEQAERALAEAVDVLRPFAKAGELLDPDSKDFDQPYALRCDDLLAARQFVKGHAKP